MRWIPGILLIVFAAGWVGWFALGFGAGSAANGIVLSRHIPEDAVITPFIRVDGSIHGDFIRRCSAHTLWYEVRWVEREDEDGRWKGFETVVALPRWGRVLGAGGMAAGLGVLWMVGALRRRQRQVVR